MKEDNHIIERHELTIERIRAILDEKSVALKYRDYFRFLAAFILDVNEIYQRVCEKTPEECTIAELERENDRVFRDVQQENYDESYANPEYAVSLFGQEMGQFLSFLYTEMRAQIAYAYEKRVSYLTIYNELFIEIYNYFEAEENPDYKGLKDAVYWFASDYCDVFVADRMEERMDPEKSFATSIILNADFSDIRYLYHYGEYISQEEYKAVYYLNSLTNREIDEMADVYSDWYRDSCVEIGMELNGQEVVEIQYAIGTERLVKAIIERFQAMGLRLTVCRNAVSVLNRESKKNGFYSRSMNLQYELDHLADQGLFLNKKFIERKLDVMKNVYEKHIDLTARFAGCISIGIEEKQDELQKNEASIKLTDKQIGLQMLFEEKMEQLTNKYLLKELNIVVVDIP